MPTVMVVGASRGIGLACVEQCVANGHEMIATCREPSEAKALKQLASKYETLTIKTMDVCDEASIKKVAAEIEVPIDTLIINAGVGSKERTLLDTSSEEMLRLFKTNALGHFLVAKHFSQHVADSSLKQIMSISSRMGSIGDNTSGGAYAYRASKAADNAIMKSLAHDLESSGVHVLIYHPGWVKTDFTDYSGLLEVDESVERLRKILAVQRDYKTGSFVSHDGSELPW